MSYLDIDTAKVATAGNDLADVAAILQRGIDATQTVQALVAAHWTKDERSALIHKALQDWHDFAPGFHHDVKSMSDFLLTVVVPTYQQLGKA